MLIYLTMGVFHVARTCEYRDSLSLDQLQCAQRIPLSHKHRFATADESREQYRMRACCVEERVRVRVIERGLGLGLGLHACLLCGREAQVRGWRWAVLVGPDPSLASITTDQHHTRNTVTSDVYGMLICMWSHVHVRL